MNDEQSTNDEHSTNDEQSPDAEEPTEGEGELLAALRRALGPDTPPAGLVERAVGLSAFADVDLELDELLREAATETVGVRGPGDDDRRLFEVADGSVSCELSVRGEQLDGQVLSGHIRAVTLLGLAGTTEPVPVDDLGRFAFRNLPAGPSRLRLDDGSGRDLVTDWFLL